MDIKKRDTRDLIVFFILTYVLMLTGVFFHKLLNLYIFSLANFKIFPALLWVVMIFSPTISALILTAIRGGKNAVKEFLKRYINFNVKWYWYLAAFALLLVPFLLGAVLNMLGIGGGEGLDADYTFINIFGYLLFALFSGPIAEEGGWRGYALPRLQAKYSALNSSLIIGALWTLWHVPLIFVAGADQASFGLIGWAIYTVLIFSLSVILTWIFNNTKGSLIPVILAHFCFNIGSNVLVGMLGFVSSTTYNIIGGVAGTAYLILILIGFGHKRFSKLPENELPIKS